MNRYSNISQATYTPLSLQEIMAVPLAKQAQHDALQAEADEMGALSASVSQADKERIGGQVSELQGRVDDISTGLSETGVSSDMKSKFRKVRADKIRAYGADGDIGFAQADYANQQKYVSEMATNKDRQQGWSAQQAQSFAAQQAAEYGSSFNEDGTRKAGFSGRSLAAKMDEDEFTRAAIDDIEEQVSASSMRIIRTQGLPAFKAIAQTSETAYKDLNLIMGHLTNATQTNPDMMASLAQQAEFDGEENWSDFGGYEEKILQDENGDDYKQTTWVPGESRYGRKIAGLGQVSAYTRVDLNETIFDDDAAQSLHDAGMDAKKVQSLVVFMNGELNQSVAAPLSEIKNSLELYDSQVKDDKANMDKYVQGLKETGLYGVDLENHLKKDRTYMRRVKNYEESQVAADNAKSRVDYIEKYVQKNVMSDNDNNAQSLIDEMDDIGAEAMYEKTFGEGSADAYKLKNGEDSLQQAKAKIDILKQKGIVTKDITEFDNDFTGFLNIRKSLKDKSDKGSKEFLATKEFAMSHTVLSSESVGKYASPIGRANELMSEPGNFNPKAMDLAYGGGKLSDLNLKDLIGEVEEGKPLEYSVRLTGTGGWDQDGNKFNDVIIKNPSANGGVTSVQVIDNNNTDLLMEAAKQMMANGTPKQKQEGMNLIAGLQYMPSIKRSNMFRADTGTINNLNISTKDGKALNVEWRKIKRLGVTSYRATIGGEEILHDGKYQDIMTENEMALAIYAFVGKKQKIYADKEAQKQQQ